MRLRTSGSFLLGLLTVCIGCGPVPQAKFVSRTELQDLIPPAKKVAETMVAEGFGTPQELVAWTDLPLEFGGVAGKILADDATANGSLNKTPVQLAAPLSAIQPNQPRPLLVWTTGKARGQVGAIRDVSATKSTTAIVASTEAEPVAGDEFIAGFGEALQYGRQVYMKNCMHCHGVTGDGKGPTAKYLNPLPRDYRNGIFKFTSTKTGERITRADLTRIVAEGIPGTYMPSFLLLGEKETKAVVEYVRFLAMRGEYEYQLVTQLAGDYGQKSLDDQTQKAKAKYAQELQEAKKGESPEAPPSAKERLKKAEADFTEYAKTELADEFKAVFDAMVENWKKAEDPESLVIPAAGRVADSAESRERGRKLYLSNEAKCYTCHGPLGKGDGGAIDDFWPKPGSDQKYPVRGLHDSWGNQLQPRNLTLGLYRGGRRPVDLYRRIHAGIKGGPMPAFGTVLKPDQIWDIVNYVMSIPYESRKPIAAEKKVESAEHHAQK